MKIECEHSKKKNISSYKIGEDSNHIEVECLDCGMMRYETRKNDGSITTSKWFKQKKK